MTRLYTPTRYIDEEIDDGRIVVVSIPRDIFLRTWKKGQTRFFDFLIGIPDIPSNPRHR